MKIEATKHIKPRIFFITAALDVLVLLIIFFLLGFSFILQSGIKVDLKLPYSSSMMHPAIDAEIIIVLPGSPALIYHKGKQLSLSELKKTLPNAKPEKNMAIIKSDERVPFGFIIKLSNLILEKGYELSYATDNSK